MPRLLKWIAFAMVGLIALIAIALPMAVGIRPFIGPEARPLTDQRFEATPERLTRGEYLANNVSGCMVCHSDIDWDAPGFPVAEGRLGSGRNWAEEELPWVTSSNLTPDPTNGIGNLSDDMVARAIREGIHRSERALFPIMPYESFRHMSDEDVKSIVVYLRTLKPIATNDPPTEIPFPVNRLINSVPRPVTGPVTAPDPSNQLAHGEYMVRIGICRDCHTPRDEQGTALTQLDLAGGNTLVGPFGSVAAVNITQAPSGIPYYDEQVFITMMRTGMVGARKIHDMMPWRMYSGQTDEDLRAVFAYLRTVPPVAHRVDNTQPPTICPRCGLQHGAGDQNQPLDAQ